MSATIYAPNSALSDAAESVARAFASGAGARVSMGGGVAFDWSTGLPRGLYAVCAHGSTDAHSVPISTYSPTGTPAVVAPGGQKPVLVTGTTLVDTPLVKVPGMYEGTTEEFQYAAGAALAVYCVRVAQILPGIGDLTIDEILAATTAPAVPAA